MNLKIVFLFLFVPSFLWAQNVSGTGSGPLPEQSLGDGLSFSVILKPSSQTLHWKITKNKQGDGGLDSITSGENIRPGEKYAYFWDTKTGILWFATAKSIMDIKLKDWSFTSALYRPTSGFEGYVDLPASLKTDIPKILGKG